MRLNTVAFISVALLTASPAFSRGFSGAEVAWATSLREREPMPAGGVSTASRGEPLYFWIRIQGDAEALGELESKGMLPIRHRWVRYGGLSSSVELDATPTDEIVLESASKRSCRGCAKSLMPGGISTGGPGA